MDTEISTSSLEKCLIEVSFPASKNKIVRYAHKHPEECPQKVVDSLDKLEKEEFSNEEEVVNEVEEEIADEISRDSVDEPDEDEAIETSSDEITDEYQ